MVDFKTFLIGVGILVIVIAGLFLFSMWESRQATSYHEKRTKKNRKNK